MYVYLWWIHNIVWQKQVQHCKAIILQLKINLKIIFKKWTKGGRERGTKMGAWVIHGKCPLSSLLLFYTLHPMFLNIFT